MRCFTAYGFVTYVLRYRRAVRNVHGMLKPGGYFVFSENFLHGPQVKGTSQVSRTFQFIQEALDQVGFEVIERSPMAVLTSTPIDSESPWLGRWWKFVVKVASSSEALGFLLGACLYPIDLLLTRFVKEGPSTEMMICRKPV